MDPRRLVTAMAVGSLLCGCATLRPTAVSTAGVRSRAPALAVAAPAPPRPGPAVAVAAMAPIPDPPVAAPKLRRTHAAPRSRAGHGRWASGRWAIAAANLAARTTSRADGFVGGEQVFAYRPGQVYEVWTAPLRVTTLTLAPGETIVAKAAGDTVRWQIGETTSGAGPSQRTHVLLKPLKRGLETNLVLTTNQRVYMLLLKSGAPDAFNAAVTWEVPSAAPAIPTVGTERDASAPGLATPAGAVDARYRISPRGRRPRWTPTAVINDGTRTFITFSPDLQVDEAPALFVIAPDGEAQMVNYRQQGDVFVVDRVFDRAELRLGARHPQVVRIERLGGAS